MTNDTTKAAPDERAELKPCPFCGDPFQVSRGGLATHINQVDCIIGNLGFPVEYSRLVAEWNTRTPPQVKPLVFDHADTAGDAVARVFFGAYYVQWDDEVGSWYGSLEFGEDDNPIILEPSDCAFNHDAMTLCQADYTRRILEALA